MATSASGDMDGAGEENAGVNTVMQQLRLSALPTLMQSETVAEKLDESYSYLDVAGYNYSDARYELDGARVSNRVIVGTETHNTNIVDSRTFSKRTTSGSAWTARADGETTYSLNGSGRA